MIPTRRARGRELGRPARELGPIFLGKSQKFADHGEGERPGEMPDEVGSAAVTGGFAFPVVQVPIRDSPDVGPHLFHAPAEERVLDECPEPAVIRLVPA